MNYRYPWFVVLAFLLALSGSAQPAGDRGFPILQLPAGARSMALGGSVVALAESDIGLIAENPTFMDSTETGDFVFHYAPFLGGINLLNVATNVRLPKVSNVAIGVTYLNYGELERTDVLGTNLGSFTPQDFLVYVSKSHRISSFILGATLKYVHSSIDGFGANAVVMDLGGTYTHPTMDLVASVVLKNLGIAFDSFGAEEAPVPLDVQVGVSFKPRYMPARFSINAHHLINGDLAYFDQSVLDGEQASFGNSLFRHINVGTEIIIGRFVNLLAGYNHLRNQELKLEQGAFGAGFSFGFLIKIKNLNIRYSRAIYHAGGGMNSIGLEGNFSKLRKIF